MKQKIDSLEGYEKNEEGLWKELSQCFELKENKSTLVFSEVCLRSSEIHCLENVIVPDNNFIAILEAHILSRGHNTAKTEASDGSLQIIKSNLDDTSEQLFSRRKKPKGNFCFWWEKY